MIWCNNSSPSNLWDAFFQQRLYCHSFVPSRRQAASNLLLKPRVILFDIMRVLIDCQISNPLSNRNSILASSIKLSLSQLSAMTILAPLTQITLMRTSTLTRVSWPIHLYSTPLFKTVSYSFCIWIIQTRFTQSIAFLTTLVIYPCIVLCSRVHSYRDGNLLARPSLWTTCGITTYKSTHNVSIVLLDASFGAVISMKVEM